MSYLHSLVLAVGWCRHSRHGSYRSLDLKGRQVARCGRCGRIIGRDGT